MLRKLTVALAMAAAASAAPTLRLRQDPCQDSWNECIAAGTPEVACSCTLAACLGEDNARNREFCATATANLPQPTTAIPGGCNPAHPGSCPTTTADAGIPGGCNPAHPGSCPTTTADAGIPGGCNPAHPGSCPTPTADAGIPGGCNPAHPGSCPTPTAEAGIPGGCNPAHPGSCPTPSADAGIPGGCNPAHPGSCPTPAPAPAPAPDAGSNAGSPGPKPIEGKKWTIEDVSRYCSEDNSGCDYNFKINADGKSESCTIVRTSPDAATESWYEQPCTSSNSDIRVSWGYAADGAPPFSVITVVWGEELAWFGVNDVNGQEVTASNPYGSGQYGNIGPEQVYTF